MADNVGARKQSGWTVYSVPPDVCKTPMGSAMVPVPYPITSELSAAFGTADSVRAEGCWVVRHGDQFWMNGG
jgi:Domain of unknown function (DUF4150)